MLILILNLHFKVGHSNRSFANHPTIKAFYILHRTLYSTSRSSRFPFSVIVMVASCLLRPASRFLLHRPLAPSTKSTFQSVTPLPFNVDRRRYATPSGVKEVAVRDALNEALAEELAANPKVFVLGEEVAQYNGA